jgi:hypothetical protein
LCAVAAGVLLLWSPWGDDDGEGRAVDRLPVPIPAGNSAGNITLSSSQVRVAVRWVARTSGTLAALHLRVQGDGSECRRSGKTGYGAGTGGRWLATTHPAREDGRPDESRELARAEFRPCEAPRSVVDVREGVVRLPMRRPVRAGDEHVTVIRNTDPRPSENYTSTNFLFTDAGLVGANARNERSADADDALYGLDPREAVGYSSDGGRSWAIPGGQYGKAGGRHFLPAYVQEFVDGRVAGQPYYYAPAPVVRERTMVYAPAGRRWTVRGLGVYVGRRSSGTLVLRVAGRERASVEVSGAGMLREPIDPIAVGPRDEVRVTARGLPLQPVVADTAWGRLMGMHTPAWRWRIDGEPNFSQAVPVYPLPGPPYPAWVRPGAG